MPRRRDAGLLPHITRVDNPYAIPEAPIDVAPDPSGSRALRTPAMPSEEWRSVVEGRFKNLKKVCPELRPFENSPIHSVI